ncbi:MAG TPA: AAC(3) family N-acetyltransferase [Anaerolineaceae bacterium]
MILNEFPQALRRLGIPDGTPVIAHASLSAYGEIPGGAAALVDTLLAEYRTLVMPVFTFRTLLTPECGPANNGLTYGSERDLNRMAVFFSPDLPAGRLMGQSAETLRRQPSAHRSMHPILSFTGVGADAILSAQTLDEPLAPIAQLTDQEGWVLLLGVNHTTNTSIHYAERLAGRKTFTRWALTPSGVAQCPNYPGCSDGFEALAPDLELVTRRTRVGSGLIQAFPLRELVDRVRRYLEKDPLGLLCPRAECARCDAVRAAADQALRLRSAE